MRNPTRLSSARSGDPCRVLFFLAALTTGLISCAGISWEPLNFDGPLIEGNRRAKSFKSCDARPMGISDSHYCIVAVEDHTGRKVPLRDIGDAVNDYLGSVPRLAPWRPDAKGNPRVGEMPPGNFPYTLHLLTISPIVLLAIPREPGDAWERFNGGFDGAIVVRALQIRGVLLSYRKPPLIRSGSFIFSPDLKIASLEVLPEAGRIEVPLGQSVLALVADGAVWRVSRDVRP